MLIWYFQLSQHPNSIDAWASEVPKARVTFSICLQSFFRRTCRKFSSAPKVPGKRSSVKGRDAESYQIRGSSRLQSDRSCPFSQKLSSITFSSSLECLLPGCDVLSLKSVRWKAHSDEFLWRAAVAFAIEKPTFSFSIRSSLNEGGWLIEFWGRGFIFIIRRGD